MTADVVSVGIDDTAERCMQIVTESRIRHLPVVDHDAVLGVVSIGDLVKAVIEDQQHELDQLQRYIASGCHLLQPLSCFAGAGLQGFDADQEPFSLHASSRMPPCCAK